MTVRLTRYGHSCIRLDDGDRALVIDPGAFSESAVALDGADAVLITHEHADHLDADRLRAAVGTHPGLPVWAPSSVTVDGVQITPVEAGQTFEAAGFSVQTFGGQHALIHPSIPVVPNVCFLIDGAVFHPGDSLIVPPDPVQVLLVPIHAPWSKVAEVVDFVVSVRAPRALQIHDAMLNEIGLQFTEAHIARLGAEHGTQFQHLPTGESIDV